MIRSTVAGLAIVSALVLAGCGGQDEDTADGSDAGVTATDGTVAGSPTSTAIGPAPPAAGDAPTTGPMTGQAAQPSSGAGEASAVGAVDSTDQPRGIEGAGGVAPGTGGVDASAPPTP